jgi:hypothetical protein
LQWPPLIEWTAEFPAPQKKKRVFSYARLKIDMTVEVKRPRVLRWKLILYFPAFLPDIEQPNVL